MSSNLVVIESPNKESTIRKYLGNNYEIVATIGHIRDIPSSNVKAFNPTTFEPNWKISYDKRSKKSKREIIDKIKKMANNANKIYLATDPDREGEAIAWHVYEILPKSCQKKCVRISFNEITKKAIELAIKNERNIDLNWVHSQFARRIIDRIIGYDLSKFVRKKFNGSSAGRVQSVALKFIYEREQEINNFKPTTTYTLDTTLENGDKIFLRKTNNKTKSEKESTSILDFKSEAEVQKIIDNLNSEYEVYFPKGKEDVKILRRNPPLPFKTSTLQQTASNTLNWSISKITRVIQDLYEGINVGGEHIALITYPRTDSVRMSDYFKNIALEFIRKSYGEEYANSSTKFNNKKNDNVQDAHECIRIIDPHLSSTWLNKMNVNKDYVAMYDLIWKRSIACLMTPCRYIHKTIRFKNNDCKFFTYSNSIEFSGYRKVYSNNETIEINYGSKNIYQNGQKFKAKSITIGKHTTTPPPRYNQASLVEALDDAGVGRPSTYKMMVDINPARGYCEIKNKSFYMSKIGDSVIEGLIKNFNDVIDKNFTKNMEQRLDAIADKKEPWNEWLKSFVPKFRNKVDQKNKTIKTELLNVGKNCPKCGSPLVYRFSKKSKKQFIGCSNYPSCSYVEFPDNNQLLTEKCPKCGNLLVQKTNKWGKKFIGCSNYPKCNFICNNLNELKKYNSKSKND